MLEYHMQFSFSVLSTILGVVLILINYIQIIKKGNKRLLKKASYTMWGLIGATVMIYFLSLMFGIFYTGDYVGTFERIFAFATLFIWIGLEFLGIWVVFLHADHKNIKIFWGYALSLLIIIKKQVLAGDMHLFFAKVLNAIYIFLITFGLATLYCNLFTNNKHCDKEFSGTKIEYTIWTLGYLTLFIINSLNLVPVKW